MTTKELLKKIQNLVGTTADGIWGPKTQKAVAAKLGCSNTVKALQKAVGTTADGIVGPNTLNAILSKLTDINKEDNTESNSSSASNKTIALLPGHSSKDGGAVMVDGLKLSEYSFANKYIPQVKEILEKNGFTVVVTSREQAGGTTPSYSAKAANATGACMAVEFHFNSASASAQGAEFLYDAHNNDYKKAAQAMQDTWTRLTNIRDRGILPVCTESEANKLGLSRYTSRGINAFTKSSMFFTMTEPFFGSNYSECDKVYGMYKSGDWAEYMAQTIIAAYTILFE